MESRIVKAGVWNKKALCNLGEKYFQEGEHGKLNLTIGAKGRNKAKKSQRRKGNNHVRRWIETDELGHLISTTKVLRGEKKRRRGQGGRGLILLVYRRGRT